MTYFQAVILGIVQGLTEFFPVSSSGHLVLVQRLFGINGEVLTFDIAVHFATLLAVAIVFRARITELILGTLRGVGQVLVGRPFGTVLRDDPAFRVALAVVIGTVPAVIVGFTLKDVIESLFHTIIPVLTALLFTGIVLLATFAVPRKTREVGIMSGIMIGLAQALAIIPGISRSGMTISAALFLGIDRERAGEFSFILSIPAILGATVLAVKDVLETGSGDISLGVAAAGMVGAFISGLIALVLLMRVVRRGTLGWFGVYCLAVAVAGMLFR